MPLDLQTTQLAVGIIVSVLAILGTVLGWFKKVWHLLASVALPTRGSSTIEIPSRTLILLPVPHANALWLHMGAVGKNPAMQIVGELNATNISQYGVYVMGVKLRRPRAMGHAAVRAQTSRMYGFREVIPAMAVSDLRFDFFVQPPVRKAGVTFKADLAILDQFGNEHWLKGLEFPYK
jgi:hypothetical protein